MSTRTLAAVLCLALCPCFASADEPEPGKKYPVGKYPARGTWHADHDAAWAAAKADGKLVMLKFLFEG